MNNYTLKCSSTVHSHSHNHEREIMLPSFILVRGIVYIAGKWYGMEPINTSRTLEHRFYHLEDMQHTPFHCGVLNDNLHRQMQIFVKQSVRYAFSPNNTSSKEELLRVNTFFVSLPRATVQTIPSVCPSVAEGLQSLALAWYHCRWVWLSTSLLLTFSWTPNCWEF